MRAGSPAVARATRRRTSSRRSICSDSQPLRVMKPSMPPSMRKSRLLPVPMAATPNSTEPALKNHPERENRMRRGGRIQRRTRRRRTLKRPGVDDVRSGIVNAAFYSR